MKKQELVKEVAIKTGVSQELARNFLTVFTEIVEESILSGEEISLPGIGTLARRATQERECRNPKTGEKMTLEASYRPIFKPSLVLKKALRQVPVQ
jgi:DNA-binding protein HU-beta